MPREAILYDEDGSASVLVLVDDSKPNNRRRKRDVELGARDNLYVTVTNGDVEGHCAGPSSEVPRNSRASPS